MFLHFENKWQENFKPYHTYFFICILLAYTYYRTIYVSTCVYNNAQLLPQKGVYYLLIYSLGTHQQEKIHAIIKSDTNGSKDLLCRILSQ